MAKPPVKKGNARGGKGGKFGAKSDMTPEERARMEISRIRMPRDPEVLGLVLRRVGGSRMIVKCTDGLERNCKIPGKLKRYLWVREQDIVIIEPWELTPNEKGNVVYKYTRNQAMHLRRRGLLSSLEETEEF